MLGNGFINKTWPSQKTKAILLAFTLMYLGLKIKKERKKKAATQGLFGVLWHFTNVLHIYTYMYIYYMAE